MNSSKMKTLELAKKAVTRIAEVAVTQKQFDAWKSQQQKQWLKDHPTSKFGKKEATKSKAPIKQADLKKATSINKEKETKSDPKAAFNEAVAKRAVLELRGIDVRLELRQLMPIYKLSNAAGKAKRKPEIDRLKAEEQKLREEYTRLTKEIDQLRRKIDWSKQ